MRNKFSAGKRFPRGSLIRACDKFPAGVWLTKSPCEAVIQVGRFAEIPRLRLGWQDEISSSGSKTVSPREFDSRSTSSPWEFGSRDRFPAGA